MSASLFKYFNEQGSQHPGELQWPGTGSGFPLLGPPENLTQSEYESIDHAAFYQFRVFDILTDDNDRREFTETMDRIQNRFYSLVYIERDFIDADGKRKVWLEWVQIYGVTERSKDAIHAHTGATDGTAN